MLPHESQSRMLTTDAEARVVAELETRQRHTVTTRDIAAIIETPIAGQKARDVVALLRKHGWIRALPLRGTYEFQPAVGGPFPSGDPWLELGVALTRNPHAFAHVGLGSAAFLRRLADRRPLPDTIVWDAVQPVPPGLRELYRVVRCTPARFFGTSDLDGVPVADVERVALEVAMWPAHAGDLRNGDHWLRNVFDHVDANKLYKGARLLGPTVTARAGYLAESFGARTIAEALRALPRSGPVWLGTRSEGPKCYSSTWNVYDMVGVARIT